MRVRIGMLASVAILAAAATGAGAAPYQITSYNDGYLNLRSGPSTDYPVLAQMPTGSVVNGVNPHEMEPVWDATYYTPGYGYGAWIKGSPWVNINWGGISGWASTCRVCMVPMPEQIPLAVPVPVPVPATPGYAGPSPAGQTITNNITITTPPTVVIDSHQNK